MICSQEDTIHLDPVVFQELLKEKLWSVAGFFSTSSLQLHFKSTSFTFRISRLNLFFSEHCYELHSNFHHTIKAQTPGGDQNPRFRCKEPQLNLELTFRKNRPPAGRNRRCDPGKIFNGTPSLNHWMVGVGVPSALQFNVAGS